MNADMREYKEVLKAAVVCDPHDLGLAVALTDVRHQIQHGFVGRLFHGIRAGGVAGYFDGDSSVVVIAVGSTPGAIALRNVHSDFAVVSDAVVGGNLALFRCEYGTERFHTELPDHAVNADSGNRIFALTAVVRAEFGIKTASSG